MDEVAIAHRGTVVNNDPVFDMVARAGTTTKMEEKILASYTSPSTHNMQKRTGLSGCIIKKHLIPVKGRAAEHYFVNQVIDLKSKHCSLNIQQR